MDDIQHQALIARELADEMTAIVDEAAAHVEAEVARMLKSIRYNHTETAQGAGEAVKAVFRRHQFRVGP